MKIQNNSHLENSIVESKNKQKQEIQKLQSENANLRKIVWDQSNFLQSHKHHDSHDRDINVLSSQIEAKDTEINILSNQIEAKDRHINVLSSQIEDKDGDINILSSQIEAKDRDINALLTQIEAKDRDINENEDVIETLESKNSRKRNEIEDKDKIITELKQKIEIREKDIRLLNVAIATNQKQLENRSKEEKDLKSALEEIERLKSSKNVNNERIKELEDVAERNGKTIQSLKNELGHKIYELGLLNNKVAAPEKEEDGKSRRSLMSSILNKKNDTAQGNFQGNEFKTRREPTL